VVVVARIGSGAVVVGVVMLTGGCLTGLGLPPPAGGGGEPGGGPLPSPPGGGTGATHGGAGPGSDGAAAAGGTADGGPLSDASPSGVNQERWATQQGVFLDGAKWLAGDFDGDGRADLAEISADNGSATIGVYRSVNTTFVAQRWATQQNGFWGGQKWVAGDFDGDGKVDLANVFSDAGQASIDVHLSTGSSFSVARWATRQNGFWDSQKWVAGDFNGDGRADLANIFDDRDQISIDVHLSTGSGFVVQRWATQQAGFWDAENWLAGRFQANDPGDDLINVFNDWGAISIDLHSSNGFAFTYKRLITKQGEFSAGQKWLTGDFDNDGWADLADVFGDAGLASADVRLSALVYEQHWFTRQGGFWDGQLWFAGDFDGDGFSDFANVFGDNGLVSIDVHRRTNP